MTPPALVPDRKPVGFAQIAVGAVLVGQFIALFWVALRNLRADLWQGPEPDQGLLLLPVAVYLMLKQGLAPERRAQPLLGSVLLTAFIALRLVADFSIDKYTLRLSMLGAALAIIVFYFGVKQVVRWGLPLMLLLVAMPLPDALRSHLSLPLQLISAKLAAAMLATRDITVELAATEIRLPNRILLVTEGCSGLRSLMTISTLALLLACSNLRSTWARVLTVVSMVPIAIFLNAVRIFLTGFIVLFINPALAEGTLHYVLGGVIFAIHFAIMLVAVRLLEHVEPRLERVRT